MALEFIPITNLSLVDFNGLFAASAEVLDSNYMWPDAAMSTDEKRQHYLSQLQSAIAGNFGVHDDTDTFFMFKVTNDGVDLMLNAGFVSESGVYRTHWYLTRPDAGSRNWIYSPAMATLRRKFFANSDIVAYEVRTIAGSQLYTAVKQRINSGSLVLLAERPTVAGDNPFNLVTLTVEV